LTDAGAGLAAVVLGIVGLAGLLAGTMAAIATIVVGFALMLLAAVVLRRFLALVGAVEGRRAEEGSGVAIGLLGGGAGVVLGILALLGVSRLTLVAIAIITFGATLILGSTVYSRLDRLEAGLSGTARSPILRLAASATASAQALFGVAGVVLGILALVLDGSTVTLELTALLAFGVAVLFSSPAATSKALELLGV